MKFGKISIFAREKWLVEESLNQGWVPAVT